MEIITVDASNIDQEHICCSLSDTKGESGYKGFKVCDTAYPYFELLYLPLTSNESVPSFKECIKAGEIKDSEQVVIFYSYQCPFTEKCTHIIEQTAKERGISFGKFVTHEIVTQDRFIKLLEH